MAEIPQWGPAPRRYRREIARQLAKEIMKNARPPAVDKGEWNGWFLAAAMAIILALLAPKIGRSTTLALLFAIALCLIYPIWRLRFVQRGQRRWLRFSAAMLLASIVLVVLGIYIWPPIRRHNLSVNERAQFENPLKAQNGGDLKVQFGCPAGDEKTCIFAGQFVSLFGESGWNVDPAVSRVAISKATEGVVIYRKGGDKEDMLKRWNSGGWFPINEPHVLALHSAFRSIHIEIDSGINPDMGENVIMIYFGPERENEAKATNLTKVIEWVNGKRTGPFPTAQ